LGVVGGSLSLSGRTLSVVLIIFAVVMVLMGLSILGLGRVFRFRGLKMPRVLSRGLERLKNSKNPLAPLLLGGITFFLPCGFTQSMQVIALGSGSFLAGAMVLFLFALGTVPVLFAAGFSASWTHFKQVDFLRITAGILIIVFAGYTLVSATSLIDYKGDIFSDSSNAGESTTAGLVAPNGPDSVNNNAQPSPDKSLSAKPPLTPADVNKEQPVSPQRVEMHVTYRGFEPAVLKVKAGVPVRWVIYGDQVTGCTSRIIIPSYSVSTSIQSGQNVVVFTPSKTGRVPFSCWMGMVRGVFVVE
jgi:sulfite exporter TauE/SafE/plastocyanin